MSRQPKMDERLLAVASQIEAKVHADIGSDHANLLVWLLQDKAIDYGIAIENKRSPFENSVRALDGMVGDARLGDGLQMLHRNEADSLSICGLGSESIRDILLAHPYRVPDRVVLQVFHKPEILRRWALQNGFHLAKEIVTGGSRAYTILNFVRCSDATEIDPAYRNVDLEAALIFGPTALKQYDPQFDQFLSEQESWWRQHTRLGTESKKRLDLIRGVMADRKVARLPMPDSSLQQQIDPNTIQRNRS